ncbi:hypothetical protein D042_4604 [Vibrio parahaemolyticus NIHCB0757]|nr:hypothetical protein D042_4604 [Vibrio parahaemolyticus NIHCB0757]
MSKWVSLSISVSKILVFQRNDNAQVGEIYAMIKALNKPQD